MRVFRFTLISIVAILFAAGAPAVALAQQACPAPDWQYELCERALGHPCPLCPGDPGYPVPVPSTEPAPTSTVVETTTTVVRHQQPAQPAPVRPQYTG